MATGATEGLGKLKRAAERGPRRTGLKAVVFLAIAAGAAALAAFLLTRYVELRTAGARIPTTKVVVAALDLPEATPIRVESLAVVDWPLASVPEGVASDPGPLLGRVLVQRLVKGQPILAAQLASAEAGHGLAALLPEGMRAAAVRVNDVVGVAGFIHPGDHVDVIVTMQSEGRRAGDFTSKIILQNIRVLAVGKQLERNDRAVDKSVPVTVATLMVDSEQSEMLALAASKGQILLTLRSRIDDDIVDTGGVSPSALIGSAPQVVARAVRKGAPPPAPARKDSVEILRGNLYERRDFEARAGR